MPTSVPGIVCFCDSFIVCACVLTKMSTAIGCVPVRVASQAISMLEGSLGWLGSTASTAAASVQEKAKSVKETVTSEEFVDKAWSNVKSSVEVGGSVAASASNIAKSTSTKVSAIGKSAITTVVNFVPPLLASMRMQMRVFVVFLFTCTG